MRIILFFLKCAVGLFASLGVLVVAAGLMLGLGWQRLADWAGAPAADIPERAVLTLDLTAGLREQPAPGPFAAATSGGGIALAEAVAALDAAAGDARIKGLSVRLGRGTLGLAQAQDLHAAVRRFRESGKPAYAFAESLDGGGGGAAGTVHAYLASAFDRVWMQPSGDYALLGFRSEVPFLRAALDSLGITPQLGQREAYKGAASQALAREMPAPQRENLQRVLDSWLDDVVAAVAAGRGLDAAALREVLATAPLSAEAAQARGLVDALGYRQDARTALRAAAGPEVESLPLASYANLREKPADSAPAVAVVYGTGAVILGESNDAPGLGGMAMGADTVAPAIRAALEDDSVRAIVLRIDSPGGSYVASDAIWNAVQAARESDTPIVVSMGNIAASGGYFVAAPANRIVAQPGTLTGSIGVVSGKFVLSGLWDKLEINVEGVQAGPRADFWSVNAPFSEAEWARLQESLDESYADFLDKVAQGRGLDRAAVRAAAQGKVWSGRDAQARGLVDVLGGYRTAVAEAKDLAGIAPETAVRTVVFPEPEPPLRRFLEQALAGRVDSPAARVLARLHQRLAPLLDLARQLDTGPPGRLTAPAAARNAADGGA